MKRSENLGLIKEMIRQVDKGNAYGKRFMGLVYVRRPIDFFGTPFFGDTSISILR